MGEEVGIFSDGHANSGDRTRTHNQSQSQSRVIDIYPLSSYYFGSKEALHFKEETLADRTQRLKSKYFLLPSVCILNWVSFTFRSPIDFFFFSIQTIYLIFTVAMLLMDWGRLWKQLLWSVFVFFILPLHYVLWFFFKKEKSWLLKFLLRVICLCLKEGLK